jgi:chromosome segregation ATPase
LSKRVFYPSFIGGILLLTLAMIAEDTGAAAKLEEEIAKNELLSKEIAELKTQIDTLTVKNTDVEKSYATLEEEKNTAFSEKEKLSSEIASLKSEITNLKEENQTITAERDSLNEEVATLSANNEVTNVGSSTASFDETTSSSVQPASTNEYYDNCSAARAAGAAPVYQDQSGYGTHLDRDGDGIGCDK